jgi:hypothetical protein
MSLAFLISVSPPSSTGWSNIDWMLVFNGILACTAIAGIIFLWRQVSLAREQLTLAENQFTEAKKQIESSSNDTASMITNAAEQSKAMVALAKANEDSASVMLRQLEAYERPWVTASFTASSRLDFDNSGLWVTFGVLLKNIGRSIATHINYDVEIVPVETPGGDYRTVIAKQDAIAERVKPQASGYVLFVGDEIPAYPHCRLENDSIKREAVTVEGDQYLTLCLAVVITYRYPTSDRDHTTRLAFIFGNDVEPVEGLFFVKLGQALPKEKIHILRLTSGNYAD